MRESRVRARDAARFLAVAVALFLMTVLQRPAVRRAQVSQSDLASFVSGSRRRSRLHIKLAGRIPQTSRGSASLSLHRGAHLENFSQAVLVGRVIMAWSHIRHASGYRRYYYASGEDTAGRLPVLILPHKTNIPSQCKASP